MEDVTIILIVTSLSILSGMLLWIWLLKIKHDNRPFEDGEQRELAKKLGLDQAWGLIELGDLVKRKDGEIKIVCKITKHGIVLVDTHRDTMYGERGVPTHLPIFKKPRLAEDVVPVLKSEPVFAIIKTQGVDVGGIELPSNPRYLRAAFDFIQQQVSKPKS